MHWTRRVTREEREREVDTFAAFAGERRGLEGLEGNFQVSRDIAARHQCKVNRTPNNE